MPLTPRSASAAIAAKPIGPQPNTATWSPGATSACSAACIPTATGSASAATSIGMPSGIGKSRSPAAASRTSTTSASPPDAAATDPSRHIVAGMDDDPLSGRHAGDLGANLAHYAGELVPERHRLAARSGESAEADITEVAAADSAGVHVHQGVPRPARRRLHAIQRHRPRRVDANLLDVGTRWHRAHVPGRLCATGARGKPRMKIRHRAALRT